MTNGSAAKPRTPLITALGLMSLVAALIALPSPVPAAGKPKKVKTQLGFTDEASRVARGAPEIEGVSKLVRIPVNWLDVQAGNWATTDLAVNAARAGGQRIVVTIGGFAAPDLGEWAAALRALHARYPDLWAVQAWNEPNLEKIGGLLSVEQTVAVVQTAREALPGVRLIGPALSPTVPGAAQYQAQLYGALPDDIGLGVNIYTYRKKKLVKDVCKKYRKAKADAGKAKVYVTEFGFHSAYFPNQAKASAKGYRVLRGRRAAAVFFYRLLPDPANTARWEITGHFNVLNDDLSATPTLQALEKASKVRRNPKCPKRPRRH